MRPNPTMLLVGALLSLLAAAPAAALFDGVLPQSNCISGKLKCVARTKTCLLGCHERALREGTAVDPTCLTKCRDRFDQSPPFPDHGCFTKLEAKGGCGPSIGDAATIAARIEAHVTEIVRTLVPAGGTPENLCASKKMICVRKYDACVLMLARKAAQSGTAIPGVEKCARYLDGSAGSCIGKLEERYCAPGDSGCDSDKPACLSFGDQSALRMRDDAFVDETIVALIQGPSDVNSQRCAGDTSVTCTSAPGGVAGCGGPLGTCEFYVGAPIPQSLGGVGICLVSQWHGPITGTLDQASWASAISAGLRLRYHVGPNAEQPCTRCRDDVFPNDGVAGGYCDSGPRSGQACDGNEAFPEPTFGTTSLDCPPSNAPFATVTMPLDLTNDGVVTKTVDASSPDCSGAPGKKCLCASCSLDSDVGCENDAQCALVGAGTCSSPAGAPRKPNSCAGAGLCTPDAAGRGRCLDGPIDQHCAIDTFRGCTSDADCPTANDHCTSEYRPCFPGYDGDVGDTITAVGSHDAPRNGAAAMTFAGLTCHPATGSSSANTVLGLPGPSRITLLGVGEDDGGPACATHASFVPTVKGPATDTGWFGLVHGDHRIGGAKVTLAATCTGAHPSCSCTLAGPIANVAAP